MISYSISSAIGQLLKLLVVVGVGDRSQVAEKNDHELIEVEFSIGVA